MTKPKEPGVKKTNRFTVVSGSHRGGGSLFNHGSPTDRLYTALYPSGKIDDASAKAELTADEARSEVEKLSSLQLIRPVGDEYRCTAPVVSETDLELVAPWAEDAASPAVKRLDELHRQALPFTHTLGGARFGHL